MAPEYTPVATGLKPLVLNGISTYRIDNETLHIDVEEVINNRAQDNTSGTLSLEMWALSQPYEGGDFSGSQLASVSLGVLPGQHSLKNSRYALPLCMPEEGRWYLALMLREWHAGAFVTRDFVSFPQPVRAHYALVLSLDDAPTASHT